MLRALTTAATGMIAQQNYLDVIANNVANVNTTGFKKSRIEFQDFYGGLHDFVEIFFHVHYVPYPFFARSRTVCERTCTLFIIHVFSR